MDKDYRLGSIVVTNEWEVVRVGADIKIKCVKCSRVILISRLDFNKKLKKVISY